MARVTIEDCLEKIPNRYTLAVAAMKRAKQLVHGAQPLSSERDNKEVVLALREIAEGKVRVKPPESPSEPEPAASRADSEAL